ncbi:NADH-quinone oxidoreductase subunit I [Balneolaceae bacterium YR4-1]|uniref:NADH-quinone oxidoreductase subunit I n=1 Tax=Halalkalibaculum roseum TaxID=2709311 RepID=A0A6M1T324_9BACT|nr:NADH-quinone oxidoreductase subunit I [Halalkalibaculum roseum]NGP76405.1 NADH-quinone oxidoreductase subunit I [Halalkalibaculum roseum]
MAQIENLDKPRANALNQNYERERKLSFSESLYLPEILKALWYSFKQIFQPTFTLNYPEEKWDPPAIFRGRPVLVEDDGKERCVACGLCARACPPLAISMQANEDADDPKERYPDFFEINMLRCIYCGYCEEVCPEEAIVMSKDYDIVFESREEAIYDKQRLLVPKEDLKERLDFLREYKNRQFGKFWDFQEENNIHSVRDRDREFNSGLSLVEMLEQQKSNDKTKADSDWAR